MNDLIKLLTGWQKVAGKWQRPSPEKPKPKKVAPERKGAVAARKPRDRGGPFGRLPGKIGAGMKKAAGGKPKKDAKKPWYRKSIYDLF